MLLFLYEKLIIKMIKKNNFWFRHSVNVIILFHNDNLTHRWNCTWLELNGSIEVGNDIFHEPWPRKFQMISFCFSKNNFFVFNQTIQSEIFLMTNNPIIFAFKYSKRKYFLPRLGYGPMVLSLYLVLPHRTRTIRFRSVERSYRH